MTDKIKRIKGWKSSRVGGTITYARTLQGRDYKVTRISHVIETWDTEVMTNNQWIRIGGGSHPESAVYDARLHASENKQ